MSGISIDELLKKLNNDSKAQSSKSKVNKLIMNQIDHLGATIQFLPAMINDEIYVKLDRVKEINYISKLFRDGDTSTWVKLLEQKCYGNLSEENQEIYQKANEAFETLYSKTDDWYTARVRKYVLVPCYITSYKNAEGVTKPEFNGPSMLIIPSHSFIKSLNDNVAATCTNCGSNSWVPLVFSSSMKGRRGLITFTFKRSTTGGGYDSSVSIGLNSEWAKLVDPEKEYTIPEDSALHDPIALFLTWQTGDNPNYFYPELINEYAENALKISESIPEPTPESEESDKDANDKSDQKPAPAPAPEVPTPAPEAPTNNTTAPF